MLFNKKDSFAKAQREKALELINEALADCTTKGDYSYILGLVDMGYKIGIIELNERAKFNKLAAEKIKKN